MPRKRLIPLAALTGAALVAAGVAAAHDGGAPGVQAAAATFDATTVSDVSSSSCTATNGDTLVQTEASYAGTSTSADTQLGGPLVIHAESLVDTTTGAGVVKGRFEIGPDGSANDGSFEAAIAGTNTAGLAEMELQSPDGKFTGSFSSTFDPQAGFSGGSLGAGTSSGAGVVLSSDQGCSSSDQGGGDGDGDQGGSGGGDQGGGDQGGSTTTTTTSTPPTSPSHTHHNHKSHHGSSRNAHKH